MKIIAVVLGLCIAMGLAGCEISKPYVITVDRVDQKVSEGNRGYMKGTPPPADERQGLKRPLIAVDIDLPSVQGKPAPASKLKVAAEDKNIK